LQCRDSLPAEWKHIPAVSPWLELLVFPMADVPQNPHRGRG
jgi:hypothetical protein